MFAPSSKSNNKNSNNNLVTSFVDRLLANPITFQAARQPDKVNLKPSTYITFQSSKRTKLPKKDDNVDQAGLDIQSLQANGPEPMVRPKSMAEAVALYTGKKYLSKKQRKELDPKPVKVAKPVEMKVLSTASVENSIVLSDTEFEGNETESSSKPEDTEAAEEVSSDEDFQTADEKDSESSDDSSEEDSDKDASDDGDDLSEASEDPEQLKKDLLDDLHRSDNDGEEEITEASDNESKQAPADEEEEEEEEDEEEKNSKTKETPPTSPDDPLDVLVKGELVRSRYDDSEFFDIDEVYEDRGSNGSTRIYKSWREFKNRAGPLGLLNHGVTCYMNSAVQALCHVPALLHYLVDVHQGKYKNSIDQNSVTQVLADTVAKMYRLDNKGEKKVRTINPKRLIKRLQDINCMMSEWQQEDSHEYFMSLMSRLQEDSTPKGVKLNQSIVYDIFGGLLSQTVTCQNCGHISTTAQEFYDLSLGLDNAKKRNSSIIDPQQLFELKNKIEAAKSSKPDSKQQLSEFLKQKILLAQEAKRSRSQTPEPQELQQNSPSPQQKQQQQQDQIQQQSQQQQQQADLQQSQPVNSKYSIENSLREFFSPELLKTDKKDKSGYVCENCKKTTNAIKISTIERAPETLAIHLKRFRFNGSSSMKVKTNVFYPDTLDLTEYTTSMDAPTKYKLSSVIVHQGRSVSSGHYIAHCRQPDGSWATYDDEYINKIKARDALRDESAYVLIYNRLTHRSVGSSLKRKRDESVSSGSGSGSGSGSPTKRGKRFKNNNFK